MPVPTDIEFPLFIKTVYKIAARKFKEISIINKRGSGRRFELFKNENDPVPAEMWVVHESKFIYSKDLQKACNCLGVTVEEFKSVADSL